MSDNELKTPYLLSSGKVDPIRRPHFMCQLLQRWLFDFMSPDHFDQV